MIRDSVVIVETWVAADGLPLSFALKQSDGTAFDLTNYTLTLTATFDATTKINAQTMTVTSAATGLAYYQPTAAEIDKAGDYRGRIWLTAAGKKRPAEDFILRVHP